MQNPSYCQSNKNRDFASRSEGNGVNEDKDVGDHPFFSTYVKFSKDQYVLVHG